MAKNNHELFESEWAILEAVWDLEPCAAPMVQEALRKTRQWSYSTVKTLMDRMAVKGLLHREKICNLNLYRSVVTQTQAQKGELMKTLKRAFQGALTPMMQFMLEHEDIPEGELNELEETIKQKRREKRGSKIEEKLVL